MKVRAFLPASGLGPGSRPLRGNLLASATKYFCNHLPKLFTGAGDEREVKKLIKGVVALRSTLGEGCIPFFEQLVTNIISRLHLPVGDQERLWNTLLFSGYSFDEFEARKIARKKGTVFGGTGFFDTKHLLALLRLRRGETVGDIGSGMGHFCVSAAIHRPDCTFVGLELVPEFVQISREMAKQLGLKNVRFVEGNALTADYLPFDALRIYNPMTLGNEREFYGRLANQLQATMKPGARLLSEGISDPMDPQGPYPDTVFMPLFSHEIMGDGEGAPVLYYPRRKR